MEMVRANGEWAAMLAETAAERDRLKAENETLRKMLAGCHETIEAQQKEIGWYVENRAEGSRLKAEVERLTAALDEQALILKAHTEALADQDRRTEAVRELHKPEEGCGHCWAEDHDQPDPYPHARWALILCDECGDRWPCLTIRALDGDA